MDTKELVVDTTLRRLVDLTGDMEEFCEGRGNGLVLAFCPHATAALVLMERGAGSEQDLVAWIDAQLPRADSYRHRHGPLGHGRDHLLPALFGSSVSVPVRSGVPLLGTWQSVLLLDTNEENNRRQVLFSFLGAGPD